MSIFDKPNEEKLSDDYPEGMGFTLYSAEYEGLKKTSFGDSHQATVLVGALDKSGETKEYRVFGRLAEQCRRLEPNELPARVQIVKEGRSLNWAPYQQDEEIPF